MFIFQSSNVVCYLFFELIILQTASMIYCLEISTLSKCYSSNRAGSIGCSSLRWIISENWITHWLVSLIIKSLNSESLIIVRGLLSTVLFYCCFWLILTQSGNRKEGFLFLYTLVSKILLVFSMDFSESIYVICEYFNPIYSATIAFNDLVQAISTVIWYENFLPSFECA